MIYSSQVDDPRSWEKHICDSVREKISVGLSRVLRRFFHFSISSLLSSICSLPVNSPSLGKGFHRSESW